jgi:hypothetical protein
MIKIRSSLVPVAHTCNTSYSGGRDQEDRGSKAAQANSLQNPSQKRTGGATQGVGSEFKPQYWKKKKVRSSGAAGVAQVVESLPSKCKVLSSNPLPPKIGPWISKPMLFTLNNTVDCSFSSFLSTRAPPTLPSLLRPPFL